MKNDLPEEKPLYTFSFRERREREFHGARARKKRRCPRNNARLFIEKMYEGREL